MIIKRRKRHQVETEIVAAPPMENITAAHVVLRIQELLVPYGDHEGRESPLRGLGLPGEKFDFYTVVGILNANPTAPDRNLTPADIAEWFGGNYSTCLPATDYALLDAYFVDLIQRMGSPEAGNPRLTIQHSEKESA